MKGLRLLRIAPLWLLTFVLPLVLPPDASAADKQLRPFIGSTFHGGTTFVDLEGAAGKPNLVVGASLVTLGEVFGADVEVADAPGFFQSGDTHLVLSSRVTTVTGSLVVAAPRRLTEYGFRPYFLAGGGVMRVSEDDYFGAVRVRRMLPAFAVGGGVVAFLTGRVGFSWEIRRFQNLYRQTEASGLTLGPSGPGEKLSFWRAGVALVYRY
jgi:hypothetical protein